MYSVLYTNIPLWCRYGAAKSTVSTNNITMLTIYGLVALTIFNDFKHNIISNIILECK